jgi:hypothetical protein
MKTTLYSVALTLVICWIKPSPAQIVRKGGLSGIIAGGSVTFDREGTYAVFTVPPNKAYVLTTFCGHVGGGIELSGSTLGDFLQKPPGPCENFPVGISIPPNEIISCKPKASGICTVSGVLTKKAKK